MSPWRRAGVFFGEVSTESLFHCSISVCGPSPTYNSTSLSGPWPSQNFILFSRGLTIVDMCVTQFSSPTVHQSHHTRSLTTGISTHTARWRNTDSSLSLSHRTHSPMPRWRGTHTHRTGHSSVTLSLSHTHRTGWTGSEPPTTQEEEALCAFCCVIFAICGRSQCMAR